MPLIARTLTVRSNSIKYILTVLSVVSYENMDYLILQLILFHFLTLYISRYIPTATGMPNRVQKLN